MANDKKTALITGAARGLGLGTARDLLGKGYRVIVTARSQAKADAAKDELGGGEDVVAMALDVSSDASADALMARLDAEGLVVDVLVNNAGAIYEGGDNAATIAEAFNNNSLGAYRLTQRLLPGMNERGFGRVVNVSSGMGQLSDMGGGHHAYRISKTAMNAITLLGHHDAGPGVKVNVVCPGWVRTAMGGASATRSLEEGVAGIVWAATLDDAGPSGGFFRDGHRLDW
jgi:NAD(P)-dependent dehydrogenase (short-subunit alcohol dehydrogenase family)